MVERSYEVKFNFPEKYPRDKIEKIKNLESVFKYFAQIFQVNLLVNTELNYQDKPKTLNQAHIFVDAGLAAFSGSTSMGSTTLRSSFFGLVSKSPIPIFVPSFSTYTQRVDLISPEGSPIGCVMTDRLFIYEHLLTSVEWGDSPDMAKTLLEYILFWFLPIAIEGFKNRENDFDSIAEGIDAAAENMRRAVGGKRDSLIAEVSNFLEDLRFAGLETASLELENMKSRLQELEQEYFDTSVNLIGLHERVEMIDRLLEQRDIEAEFDSLLGMDSIETVRVNPHSGQVIIKTKTIFKTPRSRSFGESPVAYDIGEYLIEINSVGIDGSPMLNKSGIKFYQNGYYPGEYKHGFITEGGDVCFGSGINSVIGRLVAEFNLVPLVHLLITFLKLESRAPDPLSLGGKKHDPRTDSYQSSEERDKEKRDFVNLIHSVLEKRSKAAFLKEIASLESKLAGISDSLVDIRKRIEIEEGVIEEAGKRIEDQDWLIMQATGIVDDPLFFRVDVSGNSMNLWMKSKSPLDHNKSELSRYAILRFLGNQGGKISSFIYLHSSSKPLAVTGLASFALYSGFSNSDIVKIGRDLVIGDILAVVSRLISGNEALDAVKEG